VSIVNMSYGSTRKASFGGSVAALATLACSSVTPVTPSPAAEVNTPRRIVVLGDSLAVSPSRGRDFPALLQERLDTTYPGWVVSNQGVGGDTTGGGLQRLEQALAADTSILVVELGANDGLRGVPIATIEENLSQIIARARVRGITVLLCGMETPPLNGWDYTLDYHRLFPRLAIRHDVALVPFLLEGVALNPELNGADGIHPNAAGARRIADTVWSYLAPLVASIGSGFQRTPARVA
jgi:acyl-CoA thioesterase-1